MAHLPTLVPSTPLGRVRLGALAYASLSVLPQLAQVNPSLEAGRQLAGAAAMVLLIATFVVTHTRRRLPPLEAIVVPVLVVCAGTALRDPMAAIGLAFGALTSQNLFGTSRSAVVRTALAAAALPVTIAIAPESLGRMLDYSSAPVLGLLPGILLNGVVVRVLFTALLRHERAAARERVLAHTGSQLINETDAERVRALTSTTARSLTDLSPGFGMLIMRCRGDEAVVEAVAGFRADPAGATVPWALISELAEVDDASGHHVVGNSAALDRLVGDQHRWRALAVTTADADRVLLVGGQRGLRPDVLDAFHALAAQWSLADANCGAHTALAHRADHDPLTGLANRSLLFEHLTRATDDAGDQRLFALLVIDLDDFKRVNDDLGHGAGDQVLVSVAERLRAVGGPDALPARFGGDEFAMLLHDLDGADAAVDIAERVREHLLEPFRLREATVTIGASIGVATAVEGLTAGDLLRCADIAMYSAKARGKNRVEPFAEDVHGEIAQHRLLEEHLAHAVARDEIVLHYQPQLDVRTGRCVGVEALARWQHPTLGLLPPGAFIPLAERTGHIVPIGTHVLRLACRQVMAWPEVAGDREFGLSVNVAPQQVADPAFVGNVHAALLDSGLTAQRLTVEVTESELLDQHRAHRQLEAIVALGVRIAIDDFGTGYASLASLRSFPVHQLKIDRSFLDTGDATTADDMFELVVSVGRVLELETVAEGVESAAQHRTVRDAGVPVAQGFLYARPMPPEQLQAWIARRDHATHPVARAMPGTPARAEPAAQDQAAARRE